MSNEEQLVNGCLCSSTLGPRPSTLGPPALNSRSLGPQPSVPRPSALGPHPVGPRPPKSRKKKLMNKAYYLFEIILIQH